MIKKEAIRKLNSRKNGTREKVRTIHKSNEMNSMGDVSNSVARASNNPYRDTADTEHPSYKVLKKNNISIGERTFKNNTIPDELQKIIHSLSFSGTINPVGSYRWDYFDKVSDIDLIENIDIATESQVEVFEILTKLIKQKMRNIGLLRPIIYITDFKGGEDPFLRDIYWRIQYTIDNPKDPVITLKEIRKITLEHYENGRITDDEYNYIINSRDMADIARKYRYKVVLRWKPENLIQHNPMKVLFGGYTVRLSEVLQLQPVYHKNKRISPDGIPLIKLDCSTFIEGVLMEVTNILQVSWINTGNNNEKVMMSKFSDTYATLLRKEAIKYIERKNYIKAFKRIFILYMNTLKTRKMSSIERNTVENSLINLCRGFDKGLLFLERVAGFFDIAYDMISLEKRKYPIEKLPYGKLIENIFFMVSITFNIFQSNPSYLTSKSQKFTQYCMDTLDNIYSMINVENTENTTAIIISFKGNDDKRFRLYLGTAMNHMRNMLKELIQERIKMKVSNGEKELILNELRKNTILINNLT